MQPIDFKKQKLESIFALAYGASGVGKTHFAGTVGALGRTIIIDSEKGSRTLQTAKDLQPYWNNIEVIRFDAFKDLDHMFKLIAANDPQEWSKVLNKTIKEPFEWSVIDSWSEIQWFLFQELRRQNKLLTNELTFRQNLQLQHWGAMTDLNKLAIESFKSCDKINQLFIMQEALMKDEITGQVFGGPAIHGKLVQELPGYFEMVVHMTTDIQGQYCATTRSKGRWPAKSRLGADKDYVNPRATDIFKIDT